MNPSKNVLNLYTYILCPFCKPVEYLLKANGIEFIRHELDLMKGEHKTEEYKGINPLQKVPAIIENDLILFESNTINRYLCNDKIVEDRWYPKNSAKRAWIDLFFDWYAANSGNLFKYTYAKMGWMQNLTLDEAKKISDTAFQDLEKIFLSRFKFVASEEVSIADLAIAWQLRGITSLGYEVSDRVKVYLADLLASEPGLVDNLEEYIELRKQKFGL
jgi:glutathione S-transferase